MPLINESNKCTKNDTQLCENERIYDRLCQSKASDHLSDKLSSIKHTNLFTKQINHRRTAYVAEEVGLHDCQHEQQLRIPEYLQLTDKMDHSEWQFRFSNLVSGQVDLDF